MILSEQDSGRTIAMRTGETLVLHLNENPTTGYRWSVELSEGLEQISDEFNAGEAIGAAGVRVLQFRATKTGRHQLQAKHWRTWEGESSVIARFVVNVTVE